MTGKARRVLRTLVAVFALLMTGPVLTLAFGDASTGGDWRTASHRSAGIAPDPATHAAPIVQVYAGRAFGWRGAFSVHTWLVAKPEGADAYTRYEVIGWYARSGGSAVSISSARAPDAEWYGAAPILIRDLRGPAAQAVIAKLPAAAAAYPYATTYRAWPGPNSNTFIARLAREIPELRLALPSNAIGKDYTPLTDIVTPAPSHTGWQVGVAGVLGLLLAREEGLEINVLGLVTGVDFGAPALKLPGIGRLPSRS
ncbi:MAG: DUF3750 domain-containing protein [Casimicrobiaceae bacterium]